MRSDLSRVCAAVERGLPLDYRRHGRSRTDGLVAMIRQIAAQANLRFRMAVIPAEIAPEMVLDALREGGITPCGPVHELTEEQVRSCARIVGQMGCGPLIEALEGGAQVVIAGRCCDAAIFAAEPIRRGFDAGLALHMGKILEWTPGAAPGERRQSGRSGGGLRGGAGAR